VGHPDSILAFLACKKGANAAAARQRPLFMKQVNVRKALCLKGISLRLDLRCRDCPQHESVYCDA
jgi:hypothetical protein